MSVYSANPRNVYRQSAVLTATPQQLVVMLYDGARRFLHQAATAMRDDNVELSHAKLRRAESIISHLRDTLDMEQGEISAQLQSLYLFCNRHLSQARIDRDPDKIEEVSGLLGELREAWNAIPAAA